MLKKLFFSCLCLFTSIATAEIQPISHIEDIRSSIAQPTDLVLLDIDDTLITNPFSLGRAPWRNWAKANLPKYKLPFTLYDALTLFIAKKAPYQTVEPTTADLVLELQDQGIAVFAFTARGRTQWYTTDIKRVDKFTHYQLRKAGIDFKRTKIPDELQKLEPIYFYKGIIFAQHIKKGDLLKHLFKDLNYKPTAIIFVDDKLDQVQSVEMAVKEFGIPFYGFWYRTPEADDSKFDYKITNLQLEELILRGSILTDEQALQALEHKSKVNTAVDIKQILDQIDLSHLAPTISLEEMEKN